MNYAKKKEEQEEFFNEVQKAQRKIYFGLNRIVPENLEDISKELRVFAQQKKSICESLIILIIERVWEQPQYAVIYAKLS